jgi:hypothetical protein
MLGEQLGWIAGSVWKEMANPVGIGSEIHSTSRPLCERSWLVE